MVTELKRILILHYIFLKEFHISSPAILMRNDGKDEAYQLYQSGLRYLPGFQVLLGKA